MDKKDKNGKKKVEHAILEFFTMFEIQQKYLI